MTKTDKRNPGNTYLRQCYCSRNEEIQVGSKLFAVMNPIIYPAGYMLCAWLLLSSLAAIDKIIITVILSFPLVLLPLGDYIQVKRHMLKEGHSRRCSHKVALLAMLHSGTVNGLFSDFKIIEKETNDKTSTVKKSGKRK